MTKAKPVCPSCQRRRARRACPALGQQICAVCCGTKRLTEIDCPSDCAYLQSANAHPPAVKQRQQERDLRFLLPILQGLTERQHQILFMLQAFLRAERPDAPNLTDDDVQQAASALAQTYETASRGIVYEHSATSAAGQRLAADLRGLIEARQAEGVAFPDSDLGVAFRRLEAAARDARKVLSGAEAPDPATYLSMLRRVLKNPGPRPPEAAEETGSGLIVPGR